MLRPAAYNDIVGFKPTFGRGSRCRVVLVSWNRDNAGWLARFVEDAALLLPVMAGTDAKDPVSSHHPVGEYLSAIAGPPAPRIGLLRRYFYERADAETRHHRDAAEQLAQAGAEIEELPIPDRIETAYADRRLIMSVEAAFHEPVYRRQAEDCQPKLRAMLADGLAVDGITYSRALENRRRFISDMEEPAQQCDILLTPATLELAPADRTNTGAPGLSAAVAVVRTAGHCHPRPA